MVSLESSPLIWSLWFFRSDDDLIFMIVLMIKMVMIMVNIFKYKTRMVNIRHSHPTRDLGRTHFLRIPTFLQIGHYYYILHNFEVNEVNLSIAATRCFTQAEVLYLYLSIAAMRCSTQAEVQKSWHTSLGRDLTSWSKPHHYHYHYHYHYNYHYY